MATNMETDIIFNAINGINNGNEYFIRPVLYRQLSYGEERDMYNQMVNEPNNTLIFYDERHLYRYYFAKFNDTVYHIVTNSDISRIYTIHNMNNQF